MLLPQLPDDFSGPARNMIRHNDGNIQFWRSGRTLPHRQGKSFQVRLAKHAGASCLEIIVQLLRGRIAADHHHRDF